MPFYDEADDQTNFVISFSRNPRQDFGVFARGYARAASLLANAVIGKGAFPDYEAYPAVFLYRHALELYLKDVIYRTAILRAFRCEDLAAIDTRLHNYHNLIALAEEVSKLLRICFPNDMALRAVVSDLVTISREFSELDRNSHSYRYPIDKEGNASTKRHQVANLRSMAAHMDDLLEKLDTINFGLNVETDIAQEAYEALHDMPADPSGHCGDDRDGIGC